MLKVTAAAEGPIFSQPAIDPQRDIIDPAAEQVLKQGVRTAKELTPVRTGQAQDGWYASTRGEKKFITNEVSYVKYLEYGTKYIRPHRMAEQAMRRMEKQFPTELGKQVNRVLG